MRILHISADYPDPLAPTKTRAVSNLLALTECAQHRVMSLNRVSAGTGIHAVDFADAAGGGHRAIAYGAPPMGLRMRRYLDQLADWIAEDCENAQFTPDVVHVHKLTVEGIVGQRLAARWGKPFLVSVQGNTDLKIVKAKRGLRPLYAEIWQSAAAAFPFAPWAQTGLDTLLGTRTGPTYFLPCPGPADQRLDPKITPSDAPPVIRTAFHMRDAKNKNAVRLIQAVASAADEAPGLTLEVLGGGDPEAFAKLAKVADRHSPGLVRFLGAVSHEEVQGFFHGATAFALISHRESYGMVFAEALLAGAPCLIPKGQAIDGYFEEGSVVLSASSDDETAIAEALLRLVREETAFKERLKALGQAGGLDRLTRAAISATYSDALQRL